METPMAKKNLIPNRFNGLEDRPVLKRKYTELFLSDDETEYGGKTQPLLATTSATSDSQSTNVSSKTLVINLVPPENPISGSIRPMSVYLGQNLYIDTKSFRSANYLCFYKKEGSGEIKNRFNVPISQLDMMVKALNEIKEHTDYDSFKK